MVDFSQVKEVEIPEGKVSQIDAGGVTLWKKSEEVTPFCVTALEDGAKITLHKSSGYGTSSEFQYSNNLEDWIDYDGSITLAKAGYKVYIRNTNSNISGTDTSDLGYCRIANGKAKISGDLTSMCNYSEPSGYGFREFLQGARYIEEVDLVYNSTIPYMCFERFLYNIDVKKIKMRFSSETAETYAFYQFAFSPTKPGSLEDVDIIFPETVGEYGCSSMFYNQSLTGNVNIVLPKNCGKYCLSNTFRRCSFDKIINIDINSDDKASLVGMFRECENLTKAQYELNLENITDTELYDMYADSPIKNPPIIKLSDNITTLQIQRLFQNTKIYVKEDYNVSGDVLFLDLRNITSEILGTSGGLKCFEGTIGEYTGDARVGHRYYYTPQE